MNTVKIGGTTLAASVIQDGKAYMTHAMVGETLSVDQMTLDINNDAYPLIPADQDGPLITADNRALFCTALDVSALKPGAEFYLYDSGELVQKFWVETLKHMGGGRYRITAVSIVGRFLGSRHMGGIYENVQASAVYAELLKGVRYVLDPDVAAATVTGYLPIAVRRDNLQQLLMVTGATLRVDDDGTLQISAMSSVSAGTFGPGRCYVGGSVTEENPVSGVQLTEHNYFKAGNVVTLFEDGVDGEEVLEFDQPYHSLAITGGTIVESGVNYAKISAKGTVTLTGQPYTHVTRIVTAGKISTDAGAVVRTVSRCTLANPQIAQALAERVYKFLQCSRTIKQSVLFGSERAGDVVSIFNPYTRTQETGSINSLNLTLSAVNKASVDCLIGFVPSGVISGFTSHALLTGGGNWTVPAGVYKIRIILVGGGTGGGGGSRGTAGSDNNGYTPGNGGAGGSAGAAGPGGKVFEISLDVTPGQVFNFNCGFGGVGGAGQTATTDAQEGADGTPTVFGGYSSDYGRLYPYGYYEAKTGLTMATAGADGFKGGRGGNGTDEDYEWETDPDHGTPVRGERGESVNGFAGGLGGLYYEYNITETSYTEYTGGGGGGAAQGVAGGNAGSGQGAASGGDGATPVAGANAANYGQGGGAGNGGGGGGGAGTIFWYMLGDSEYRKARGGDPGDGSRGGSGGPGAIIIYY